MIQHVPDIAQSDHSHVGAAYHVSSSWPWLLKKTFFGLSRWYDMKMLAYLEAPISHIGQNRFLSIFAHFLIIPDDSLQSQLKAEARL